MYLHNDKELFKDVYLINNHLTLFVSCTIIRYK